MRFLTSGFFHESTPYSPRIYTLKYFWILFRIRRNIRFWMLFHKVGYPAGLCLAGYPGTPQDIVLRGIRPPRRTSACYKMYKTLPLFCGVWYPAGSCSAGSDTPQDFVLWGIRLRWQIKIPQNQTKKFWELAIVFKGTLFENWLHV